MDDSLKSRDQLIAELTELRQQVSGLEKTETNLQLVKQTLEIETETHQIVLTNVSDAVFVTNDQGEFTYVCPNVMTIFGYSETEVFELGNIAHLLGARLFNPDQLRDLGEIQNIECLVRSKYGREYALLVNVKAVSIFTGTTLYTCRDITQRKQMEFELEQHRQHLDRLVNERTLALQQEVKRREQADAAHLTSEKHLQVLIDATQDSVLLIQPDGKIIKCNEVVARRFGRNLSDLPGTNAFDLLEQQVATKRRQHVQQVVEQASAVQFVDERMGRVIDNIIYPVIDQQGKVSHLAIYGKDVTEQKLAEQAIRESEEKFRKFFDNQALYCYQISPQGAIIDVNDAALQALEYEMDELRGQPLKTIYAPEALTRMQELFAQWRAGSRIMHEEITIITKSGQRRTVLLSAEAVTGADGAALYSISMQQDITSLKQAEQLLLASESKFRKLFSEMRYGCVLQEMVLDDHDKPIDYITLDMNPCAEKLLGVERESILGIPVGSILPENEFEDWLALFAKVACTGEPSAYEYYSSHNQKYFEGTAYCPAPGQCAVTFDDISARKLIEKELHESEERFRTLAQLAPVGVYVTDAGGQCLFVNQRWLEMTGLTYEQALGAGWVDGLHPDDRQLLADSWYEMVHSEGHWNLEYRLQDRTGSIIWVDGLATPRYDDQGQLKGYIGVNVDITERKRKANILNARVRLMQYAETHSLDEVLQATLDEVEKLTLSSIGFYHFLDDDQETITLQQWSSNTLDTLCKLNSKHLHYSVEQAGVWVDSIYQRSPVIHNDVAALPHRKGYPDGHASVTRELVVPIIRKDKIVAILGIGNKPADYSEQDVETVALFADLAWDIVEHKQKEASLFDREAELAAIYDNLPVSILLLDKDRRVLKANRAILENWASPNEDLVGLRGGDVLRCIHALDDPNGCGFGPACASCTIRNLTLHTLASGAPHYRQEASLQLDRGNPQQKNLLISTVPVEIKGQPRVLISLEDITDRKQGEEDLKRYKNIVSSTLDAIALLDENYRYQIVNAVYAKFSGFQEKDIIGQTVAEYLGEDVFQQQVKPHFDRCLQGETVHYQKWFTYPAFGRRFVEVTYFPYRDAHNAVVGVVSVTRDITGRKQMETSLENSEQQLKAIFDNSLNAIMVADDAGSYLTVNRAAADIFGYSVEQLLNMRLDDLNTASQPDAILRHQEYLKKGREIGEFDFVRPDGQTGIVQYHAVRVRENFNLSILSDITERKKAEDALRASEQKYRMLFENMAQGVFYQRMDGQLIDANPAALTILGIAKDQILGRDSYSPEWDVRDENGFTIAPEQQPSMLALLSGQAVTDKILAVYNPRLEDYVWVSVNAIPQFLSGTAYPDHVFVTLHDITTLKQVESQLQKSLQDKELLLKEVHHRVKNNLQIISSLLDLQSHAFKDQTIVHGLNDSKNRIHSMALIHERLYQSGDLSHIDMIGYVHSLADFLERSFGEKVANIEIHVDVDEVPVSMDIAIPCGMLINELISNAIKYAFPAGEVGRIQIEFKLINSHYCLKVADNGVGLPADFDFQNSKSLGMQLVDLLTQQLGGHVDVDRCCGTAIEIIFPTVQRVQGTSHGKT